MTTFDPKAYSPHYGGLAGFAMAHNVGLARFEALLDPSVLADIDARLLGVPAARSWKRHLVYDACVARYGSYGRVIEALGNF